MNPQSRFKDDILTFVFDNENELPGKYELSFSDQRF